LEKIELKPTNFVYTIRDDSGVIEVIQWVIEGVSGILNIANFNFKTLIYSYM